MRPVYYLIFLILTTGCVTSQPKVDELGNLVEMMAGHYSSAEQASQDSSFFDINLVMEPIWRNGDGFGWLYVEQAATANLDRPYRQRVYRLSKATDGFFESRIYELPNASRFIQPWENMKIFDSIAPDSLILREGCSVFVKKTEDECYEGSTIENDCASSLRGASYATSEVQICKGMMKSWDRGWDDNDEQVWGAEKGAYIFKQVSDD